MNNKKIAIVCDWLTSIGGAERVVLQLHKMFPKALIYTSQYDPHSIDWFYDAQVHTTHLQKLPFFLRKFLPYFRQQAFRKLDLTGYDIVISSSGAEAKFVKTGKATHICYCHAPTHYYWQRYHDYIKEPGFGPLNPLARIGLKLFVGPLRRRDYRAAQKPTLMIANSTYTKNQIKKYYGRDSQIVFPPVDIADFKHSGKKNRSGLVIVGRQTPYKKIDLAVSACTKLNLPLTVIGDGPDNKKLRKLAGPSITFTGQLPRKEIISYLQSAEGFIFPGVDDFGIAAVEALAAGTPVIAYKDGGVLDYIVEGKNGLFFSQQSSASLEKTLQKFGEKTFSHSVVTKSAQKFSVKNFVDAMSKIVRSV